MKTHIQVLGVLFLVGAGVLAFAAAAIPLGIGVAGALLSRSNDPDATTGAAILGLFGMGLAIFCAALAIVWGICGYGVLKHKSWARIFAVILCAISLIKIPFGTVFGIYGLWIMFNKETEAIFAKSPAV